MTEAMKSNIWKFYLFNFLDGFLLYLPFIVYYFQELGFSLTNIMLFSAATTIVVLLMEIPSGYIADRIGRKNSLIISVFFHIISMLFLYFTKSFLSLITAHIFLGLCMAFYSGADTALLYDTLLVMKKEKKYSRYYGKSHFSFEVGVISSALIGSLLVKMNITILQIILINIIIQIFLMLFILSIKEPKRHKLIESMPFRKEFSMIGKIIKESLHNSKLLGLFLYGFIIMGVSNTIFIIYQPYFRATELPLYTFGIVFALFSMITAFAAVKAHAIEKRLGIFYSLLVMPLLLVGALLGAGIFFVWFGFMFFFLREIVRGMIHTITSDYINQLTSSERRATVHSIGGMFARVGYSIIAISFGFFSERSSIRIMLIITGIILIILTILISFLIKKKAK